MNKLGPYCSQLFTLRLWREPNAHHPLEIRFKVQNLQSGEVRFFSSWPTVITYLDATFKGSGDDALPRHCPDDLS